MQIRLLENYGDPPAAGALMGMVYYKSGLYVYGFQESADPLSDTHTKLRKYDLNLGIWICLNPTEVLPVRVTGHTLAIMENFLYIFGGYDPVTGDVILKILKLDLDTLQWNFLNTSRTYLDFFAIQSKIQIDQFLYAAGGRGSDKNFNIIKKYDLLSPTLEFEILSENWNFPSPRKNHAMGRISNFFYIFGGQSNTGL